MEQLTRAHADLTRAYAQLQEQHVELELSQQQLQEQQVELEAQQAALEAQAMELEAQTEALAEANAALARTSALLESVLATTPDVVAAKDRDGRYLLANAATARVFGRPVADIVGRTDHELHPAAVADALVAADRAAMAADEPLVLVERVPDAARPPSANVADGGLGAMDEGLRTFRSVKAPLRDAEGAVVGLVVTARDETEREATARALAVSEARFRGLVETGTVGLVIGDSSGTLTFANDTLLATLGYTRADVDPAQGGTPLRWVDLTPPEELPKDARAIAALAAGEAVAPYEKVYRAKDGRRVPILVGPTLLGRDPTTGVLEIAAFVLDLSERERAAEALRASEARFRTVHDASPDGFQLCDVVRDAHGRVVDFEYRYLNAAGLALVGRSAEQMIGRRMLEVFPGLAGDSLFARYVTVAESGEPTVEEVQYTKDGLDAAFRVVVVPIDRESIALTFSDLTARVRAEGEAARAARQLAESEARFRRLAERSAAGVIAGDASNTLTYANEAFLDLLGYTRADVDPACGGTPLRWDALTPAEDAPRDHAALDELRRTGHAQPYEKRYQATDGRLVPVLVSPAVTTYDEAGEIVEVTAVVLDRTAERDARAALERARAEAEMANQAKSEFLANMSHELRTPLNAIQGHVQLMEMELHGPVTDAQREALARVGRAQQHLLGLINDILNFAKLESGRIEYDIRAVRVADVVADVVAMLEPQLATKDLSCAIVTPAEPAGASDASARALTVSADREKLAQVVVNLLSNAIKFTPAGGRISVELARLASLDGSACDVVTSDVAAGVDAAADLRGAGGTWAAIRVHDTGIGIPGDQLERIFEPFVQVHRQARWALPRPHGPGPDASQQGTGLGLAISRDLARGMGGDLWAHSVVGVGSTFTLALRVLTGTDGEGTRGLGGHGANVRMS